MTDRKCVSKIELRPKFNILVLLCTNLDYRDFKYQYLYRMGITAACRTLLPSSISQSSHFQSVISGKKLNGRPCHCSEDFWNWSVCWLFFGWLQDLIRYLFTNKRISFELVLQAVKSFFFFRMHGVMLFRAHFENQTVSENL